MIVFDFAKLVDAKPDHIITVLKPKIDMISFTSTGDKAIEAIIESTGNSETAIAGQYWNGFYKRVWAEAKDVSQSRVEPAKKRIPNYKFSVTLKLEEGYEPVRLHTSPFGGRPPVRLEFNPSRLPPNGMEKLKSVWDDLDLDNIPLPALLPSARITRLDIAIDLLNIRPRDLFVQNNEVWKVWSAASIDRGIETVNFYRRTGHQKSPQLNPKKRADLVIYDKKKQQKANEEEPIYGDMDHTRVESCRTKNLMFKNLISLKYPLANWEIRRALIAEPPCPPHEWAWLVDSARFRGTQAALALMPKYLWPDYPTISEDNFATYLPNDLITKETIWPHWPEAIKNAQLDTLIGWALDDPQKHMPVHGVFAPGSE